MTNGILQNPVPAEINMARYCLETAAKNSPEKTALLVIDNLEDTRPAEEWTYQDLENAVLRLAASLKARGLEPGNRIMIRLNNRSEYAILFFAALAAGLVPLPASSLLSERETNFLLNNSGARAIAVSDDILSGTIADDVIVLTQETVKAGLNYPDKADYSTTRADDPAFLIYTSGTTANPKGVLHAHRSIWGRRPMYEGWYGISSNDRVLHAGAFNWTYTMGTGLSDPWANGATSIIYTGEKSPEVWPKLIEKYNVSIFAAVPSVYRQILKYSDLENSRFLSLRHGLTAGESLPPNILDEWKQKTGTELYEALGMSELSTYISSSPSVPVKPGAIGRAQPGRRIEILPADEGEKPVKNGEVGVLAAHNSDPGLMLGYWNGSKAVFPDCRGEWFISGDLAVRDNEEYIYHRGRTDDLMNALGYRVSPLEVEQVLSNHDAVNEVAVAQLQVREDVQVIGAFIVLSAKSPGAENSIDEFATANLASYKVPKEYCFVDKLPKTLNGKVKRSELIKIYEACRQNRPAG